MRFAFTPYALMAISLALAPACKKSGAGEAVAKMTEFKDKLCACKDKACADQVSSDMTKWTTEHQGAVGQASEEDTKKLAAISTELSTCMQKLVTDAAAAQAGSGSAGSGSDAAGATAGSGDAAGSAAGSGSAADDEAMAHRAGMCPSTVQGATTKAQVKGKTIVVTVEATEKNAIASIQKRAEVLLAEKQDGGSGGAHDQKGSHGGARGLCPVYVPEGSKATAKKSAKGVAITITTDKANELVKDIEDRIPKAAEWVKANFKDGDQNQGAVGGGKGDHGANHSGKGDGKGKDREKGGDQSGTGGGGGGGSGSGTGKAGGGW